MQRKTLLVVLCCLLVVLIGLATVLAVYMMNGKNDDGDSYTKNFELGEKYFDDGDYEQAIAAYRDAIEDDPDNEEAYYKLAIAYQKLGRMDDMKDILEEGIEITGSLKLERLYNKYFSKNNDNVTADTENKKENAETPASAYSLNSKLSEICANYTFYDYMNKYSVSNVSTGTEKYSMSLNEFKATMYFENEGNYNSINAEENEPYMNVRPSYIVLENLSPLINGLTSSDKLTVQDFVDMGAVNVSKAYESSIGNCIRFTYNHCIICIATDSKDKVDMYSENIIYSEFGTGADLVNKEDENPVYTSVIHIVNAITGGGVSSANVYVFEDGTNNIVFETTTDANGNCELELTAGIYAIVIECEGFIAESFAIEVYSSGVYSADNFVISPELVYGEMRIVLEWGDYPSDLDSYLIDSNNNVAVSYRGKSWYEDGEVVAELDVDDTTSYGPETITVYDTTKDFTYYVHDFSDTGMMFSRGDVTVKVYLPGVSAPQAFTIPVTNSDNRGWCVFSWVNGRLVVQDNEVFQVGDFDHIG